MARVITEAQAKGRNLRQVNVYNGQICLTALYGAGDIVSFDPDGQKYKVMPKRPYGKDNEVHYPLLPIGVRVARPEYVKVGQQMIKHD